MIPIWRLTRNRYTRRLYESLGTIGVTAIRMIEYVADAGDQSRVDESDRSLTVSFVAAPATDDSLARYDLDFTGPISFLNGEWVVVATVADEAVGRVLVSAGGEPYITPLRKRLAFDGAYVRRLYVDRTWRGNGIATRLIQNALRIAEDELNEKVVSALITPHNKPSHWAFETNGFRPVRCHDYARALGIEYRRVTTLKSP